MTIRFTDGHSREALLLSRTERTMRVMMEGGDDAADLVEVNGAWLLGNCERVQVEFAWEKKMRSRTPVLSACVCPAELASKLVDLLYSPSPEVGMAAGGSLTF